MEKDLGPPEGQPAELKPRDAPSSGLRTTEGLESSAIADRHPRITLTTPTMPTATPVLHNLSTELGMKGSNIDAPLSTTPKAGTGGKPSSTPNGKELGLPFAQVPESRNPLDYRRNQGGGAKTVLKGAQGRPVPRAVQEVEPSTLLHLNTRAETIGKEGLGVGGANVEIPSPMDGEQRQALPAGSLREQGPSDNLSRATPEGGTMHAPTGMNANAGNWPPRQPAQSPTARRGVSPVAGMAPEFASPVAPSMSTSPGPTGVADSHKGIVTPASAYEYLFPQEVPPPPAGGPPAHP